MIKCKMSLLSRSVYVGTAKKGVEQDRPIHELSHFKRIVRQTIFFSASGRLSCPRVVYVTNIFLFNFDKNNFGFQSINATVFYRESETNCHPQIPASWHVLISSRQSHFCHHHLQTDFCFPIKGNVMKTSDDNLFARFPAPPHRRLREIAANCLLMIFCSDFY